MSNGLMYLPTSDYQIMNCSPTQFSDIVTNLSEEKQFYVVNATNRLAEADWVTDRLEKDVGNHEVQNAYVEGLLSLQVYLLLTCADTLGHVYVSGGVGKRFKAFFNNLPQSATQNLIDDIFTWQTNRIELDNLGLVNTSINSVSCPSRQQIMQAVQQLSSDERFNTVIEYLYRRRNDYTHESKFPILGLLPNLTFMQKKHLNMPDAITSVEYRIQALQSGNDIYFSYYETDDVVATIRRTIVQGLGQIVGTL